MNLKTGQITFFEVSIFVNVVVQTSLTLYLTKKSSCNYAPEGLDCERKEVLLQVSVRY